MTIGRESYEVIRLWRDTSNDVIVFNLKFVKPKLLDRR